MERNPRPITNSDLIAGAARAAARRRAEVAAKQKKFGIGTFKFPKSKGANSSAMYKGK